MSCFKRSKSTPPRVQHSAHVHMFGLESVPAPLRNITLDNVLSGETCSPIGLPDFDAYLTFVEGSLASLQFVIWHQSYKERFYELPVDIQLMSPMNPPRDEPASPPSSPRMNMYTLSALSASSTDTMSPRTRIPIFSSDTSMVNRSMDSLAAPSTTNTPFIHRRLSSVPTPPQSPLLSARAQQPFRTEIARIVATFFVPNAPKRLPLSDTARANIVQALTTTTHPDTMAPAHDAAYEVLRQALPRFLAQSVVVTNRPKQLFWTAIGCAWLAFGLAVFAVTLLAARLGHMSPEDRQGIRALRVIPIPFVAYGAMVIAMAARGHCGKIARRCHIQLRPWEIPAGNGESTSWWAGIRRTPEVVQDADEVRKDSMADDLSDTELGLKPSVDLQDLRTDSSPVLVSATLTLRARRHARCVRERLLDDLSNLEIPLLVLPPRFRPKTMHIHSPPTSPVLTTFSRADISIRDDDPAMPPGLIIDVYSANRSPLAPVSDVAFPADEDTFITVGSMGVVKKTYPLPSAQPSSSNAALVMPAFEPVPLLRAPPVFGPEKVVLDPRVLAVHQRVKFQTGLVALVSAIVFAAVFLAIPVVV